MLKWMRPRACCGLLAATLAVGVAACGPAPEEGLLEQAEQFYLDGQYDAAIPLLKRHLLAHPDDVAAHFYLGSSYTLASEGFHLTLGRGELETALAQYQRSGAKVSPIERFSSADYFELRCHLELGKVLFKQVVFMLENRWPSAAVNETMRAFEETYEAARRISPESDDVKNLEGIIRDIQIAIQGSA